MRKLLIVYNTCEIKGRSNVPWYINSLQSFLYQTALDKWGEDYKVALSGCMMTDETMGSLVGTFLDYLSYNSVQENVPLSISFNDTVEKCVKHYGEFEGYMYVDSGITMWDPSKRYDAIENLWEAHKSGPYAITAAMPSNDDGSGWWGIQYELDKDYIFPVGKATNMHCQIFSNEWRKAYGKILPDIYASNCMESTFSYQAAAIQRKYQITQKAHVLHLTALDGASIGSRDPLPDRYPMSKNFPVGGLLYKTQKTMDERHREGYEYGFGFEGCAEYWRHDPDKFDENGYAKDERLLPFLAKELYLSQEELDYSKLNTIWRAGR